MGWHLVGRRILHDGPGPRPVRTEPPIGEWHEGSGDLEQPSHGVAVVDSEVDTVDAEQRVARYLGEARGRRRGRRNREARAVPHLRDRRRRIVVRGLVVHRGPHRHAERR